MWCGPTAESPVWRVNAYRAREGGAAFTSNLDALHGVEQRQLKTGALRWGWREIQEEGERLYQVECEVIAGAALYFLTATCASSGDLGQVAQTIGQISVVNNTAKKETIHTS